MYLVNNEDKIQIYYWISSETHSYNRVKNSEEHAKEHYLIMNLDEFKKFLKVYFNWLVTIISIDAVR